MAEEEIMNEEAQLAQEALEATPETPAEKPETKVDPKDAVIGEFRRELRETRRELAGVVAQQTAKEPVKSPLELAKEKLGTDETLEFTPELYEAQRKFEQGQATARSEQEVYEQQRTEYEEGLLSFPEREQLIAEGGHLLTEGDQRNIWEAGKKSGQELKRILTHRIELNQPEEKPAKADKTKKTDKSKKAEEEVEVVPTQEEILKDKALDDEYKTLACA